MQQTEKGFKILRFLELLEILLEITRDAFSKLRSTGDS